MANHLGWLRQYNDTSRGAGGYAVEDVELQGIALVNIQLRRSLRSWGIDVDNAHPGAHVTYEYDPPLARCPTGCHAPFVPLDAPGFELVDGKRVWKEETPASPEKAAWGQAGYPGRRQCGGCGTVFEAQPVPATGRKLARVRLETPEETEARVRATAEAMARTREQGHEPKEPLVLIFGNGKQIISPIDQGGFKTCEGCGAPFAQGAGVAGQRFCASCYREALRKDSASQNSS